MITAIVAYALISLSSGLTIQQFQSLESCVEASYHVSLVTGQETRCEPVRRVTR